MTSRVRAIEGNTITLTQDLSGDHCFGCMNRECRDRQDPLTLENKNALPLRVGQLVEVENSLPAALIQALIALLPPIAGFIAGYLLTRYIFPLSGEGAHAAGGLILLFLAALILYWVRKRRPAQVKPRIVRIVNEF